MKLMDDLLSKEVTLPADKSAVGYVFLAVFFGSFGVHNLWAGNAEKGKAELIAGIISLCCTCGALSIVNYIIACLDIAYLIEAQRKQA